MPEMVHAVREPYFDLKKQEEVRSHFNGTVNGLYHPWLS